VWVDYSHLDMVILSYEYEQEQEQQN
jgi:hypothetical protein